MTMNICDVDEPGTEDLSEDDTDTPQTSSPSTPATDNVKPFPSNDNDMVRGFSHPADSLLWEASGLIWPVLKYGFHSASNTGYSYTESPGQDARPSQVPSQ